MSRSPLAFDLRAFLRARMPLVQPNDTRDTPNGEKVPLANGLNGRDAQGKFTHCNTGGPGNPFNRQIAAFRRAVCAAVTVDALLSHNNHRPHRPRCPPGSVFSPVAVLWAMAGDGAELYGSRTVPSAK